MISNVVNETSADALWANATEAGASDLLCREMDFTENSKTYQKWRKQTCSKSMSFICFKPGYKC
jgi:hypothetical protein